MKKSLLALTIAAALPLSAFAADKGDSDNFGPKAGDNEFTLSGTGSSNKDFNHGNLGLAIMYGKYIDDNWEWSLRQSINFADLGNRNFFSGATRAGLDYNWDLGRWRPLAGVNIGGIYGHSVSNTGIAGPEVGVKYYVKPDTFVYLLEEYQFFFKRSSDIHNNFNKGAFAHTLGVGFNY